MRKKSSSALTTSGIMVLALAGAIFFSEVPMNSSDLVEIKDSPYFFLPSATYTQILLDADESFYVFHITNGDLYYREYDSSHKPVKNDTLLYSDGSNCYLHVELDSYDHFHVVWSTDHYGALSVMYTKMDLEGNVIVPPIKVSDDNTYNDRSPKVGPNSIGQAFVYWDQKWSSDWYAQDAVYAMVDADGSILVPPTFVAPSSWDTEANVKDLLVDPDDNLHVVYQLDDRYSHDEWIYYKKIGSDGTTVLIDNKQLINDVFYYWHNQIRLLWDSNNQINFVYSWGYKQGSLESNEVWWAKLDLNGTVLIGPVSVTQIDGIHSASAYLVNDEDENNYILWSDKKDGNWEAYYAVLDSEGNLLKNETRITNTSADTFLVYTSAVINSNGECFWVYYEPDGAYVVYATSPVADVNGPYYGEEGQAITLDGTASYSPLGNILTHWDVDGDGLWDTAWQFHIDNSSIVLGWTYSDDFIGSVCLEVWDGLGSEDWHYDIDCTNVTIVNAPPHVANIGPAEGAEGVSMGFLAYVSDPGDDDLELIWSWGDGTSETIAYASNGTAPHEVIDDRRHTYGDNRDFTITLRVEDDDGGSDEAQIQVTVLNVDPIISDVSYEISDANASILFRIAGEKWHNVEIYLFEDYIEIGYANITRYPGSPNDQMAVLADISVNFSRSYSAIAYYTPLDNPINGQIWGANPAWLIIRFDNEERRIHHTFNVRHPETWIWNMEDLNQYLPLPTITVEAIAYDPGSDDLIFTWNWGDGTITEHIYYNDGVGPDPYPSPNVNPMTVTGTAEHRYLSAGTYTITLTVTDDDGGQVQNTFVLNL